MKKNLIVFYSKSGNNRFLANKLAKGLDADIEELQPKIKGMFFHIMAMLTKISMGNKPLDKDPASYENVVLVGPLWMGAVIPPLKDFIKKFKDNIKNFYFVTGCGAGDDKKNDKFGYATMIPELESLLGGKPAGFEAFPIELILTEEEKKDSKAAMAARFNEENFKGPAQDRLDQFISKIN